MINKLITDMLDWPAFFPLPNNDQKPAGIEKTDDEKE
jgi:hypothetical protein